MAWCLICSGSPAGPLTDCRFHPCSAAHPSPLQLHLSDEHQNEHLFLDRKESGTDFLAESGSGSEFPGDFLAGKCSWWSDAFQDLDFLDGCDQKCNGFVIQGFGVDGCGQDCLNLGMI